MTDLVIVNPAGARPVPRTSQLFQGHAVIGSLHRASTGATLVRGHNGCFRVLTTFVDGATYANGWTKAELPQRHIVRVLDRAVVIGKMAPEHAAMLRAYRARQAARRALEMAS